MSPHLLHLALFAALAVRSATAAEFFHHRVIDEAGPLSIWGKSAADLNGDGRPDIVLSPSEPKGKRYRVSWFEAPADPKAGPWREHVIEPDIETVQHFVGVADFNLDGQPDVATAAMLQGEAPQNVTIHLNAGGGARWTTQVIGATGSHSMRIVDLDGDGVPSLFGANHQSAKVELWRNMTRRVGASAP